MAVLQKTQILRRVLLILMSFHFSFFLFAVYDLQFRVGKVAGWAPSPPTEGGVTTKNGKPRSFGLRGSTIGG